MPPLPTDLRSQLGSTVVAARTLAETAAAAALTTLAVARDEAFPAMTEEQRRLRRALRARARQLGEGNQTAGLDALIHEIAYEQWHRMLFARFQAGEPPYDIYVRRKSVAEQPLGWQPDLNDGVHLNIRPSVTAGVLRKKFTIHWHKDRGRDPDGGERINDRHVARAVKVAARQRQENAQ